MDDTCIDLKLVKEKYKDNVEVQDLLQIIQQLEDKLYKIDSWCKAYPLDIFPEPNFKKAHKILKENGMTLDAISASNMRHVLKGIQKIIMEE